jgi:AcrR family transcriptional regulator
VNDVETRQRLLEAAAKLFARRGLNDVTVREICRTGHANVAAVNYHFQDKLGLYTAVVHAAIDEIRGTSDMARHAGEGASAEERLRIYIRVFLERVAGNGRDAWIHQLITREMAEPTPAFDLIIKQAIRPRIEYLAGLVAEVIDCAPSDDRVMRCIASLQSQFLFFLNPGVARVYPKLKFAQPTIDELAEHIAEFSLAGIRAVGRRPAAAHAIVARRRRRDAAS